MKYFSLLWVAIGLFCHSISAQTLSARMQVQGIVSDTASKTLEGATVMLLLPKDSSLVNFGRTNAKGEFIFKNVKRQDYVLKVSYLSFIPYHYDIKSPDKEVLDLGTLSMKPITRELFEVVVKTARAPLTIRGDTIEYNAASFKVPPGSTVEDLLRKLPGVQVDKDGNIIAQGQQVQKVTVDGKSFFGNDPKMATKNLPAEAITKVQVFNDKSEQAKATGIEDGKKEKTVNLELKEEFKKGGFGKVTAGTGAPENRSELKANYNKFDEKNQFAVIGLGNNTNQTGMSWNDYQDFRGSNAYNWGDEADFGFGGGMRYFSFGDDDVEGDVSIPVGGGRSGGYSNNFAGGVNYNYNSKKIKVSSNYYYNSTRRVVDAVRNRTTFLDRGSISSNETSSQINFAANHRASFRLEKTIDTLNTVVFITNNRLSNTNSSLLSNQALTSSDGIRSNININNRTINQRIESVNTVIYRHKFEKKGRNFAWSGSFSLNNTDGSSNLFAQFQENTTDNRHDNIKTSVSFTEPLSKKFSLESFYNFSTRKDMVDRDVLNKPRETQTSRNDALSSYYTNQYTYNRLGTGLRYMFKGINLSAGLAAQQFDLEGRFATDQTSTKFIDVNQSFFAWIPNISVNLDLKNNKYLWAEITKGVQEPSTRDLQPVIDNSNPLYIREGNPSLLPAVSHSANAGFHFFDPGSFINFSANGYYSYQSNQVVYNQQVDTKTLVTRTKPVNLSGGWNAGMWLNFGFPIKKTKSTLSLNSNPSIYKSLLYINGVLNESNSNNYRFGSRIDWTPNDNFAIYGNGNWNISNTKYSINTTQNQRILNYTYGADMNFKVPGDIYVNSSFNYRIFVNDRYNVRQQVPILNFSMYRLLGKSKKAEIRLSAYDLFNKNIGITQTASQNYVSDERVSTLSRYVMLSFSYNMRGIKAQTRKQDGWW